MTYYEDEEPEVEGYDDVYPTEIDPLLSLDAPPAETDIYGNAITPPEWSGADEVDGEELIEFLLSGEASDDD